MIGVIKFIKYSFCFKYKPTEKKHKFYDTDKAKNLIVKNIIYKPTFFNPLNI
jgi:hypothetical protein